MQMLQLTKKVTSVSNGLGHLISLPTLWMKQHGTPRRVIVFLGDILLVVSTEDKELAEKAAEVLINEGLLTPMDKKGGLMRVDSEKVMEAVNG